MTKNANSKKVLLLKYLNNILKLETNIAEYKQELNKQQEIFSKLCKSNLKEESVFPSDTFKKTEKNTKEEAINRKKAFKIGKNIGIVIGILTLFIGGFPFSLGLGISCIATFIATAIVAAMNVGVFMLVGGLLALPIPTIVTEIKINNKKNEEYKKVKEKYNEEKKEWDKSKKEETIRLEKESQEKINVENQIEKLKIDLASFEEELAKLYAMGILTPIHQNLEAVKSIHTLISNGLTNSLERKGHDPGAYNMYREEILNNQNRSV